MCATACIVNGVQLHSLIGSRAFAFLRIRLFRKVVAANVVIALCKLVAETSHGLFQPAIIAKNGSRGSTEATLRVRTPFRNDSSSRRSPPTLRFAICSFSHTATNGSPYRDTNAKVASRYRRSRFPLTFAQLREFLSLIRRETNACLPPGETARDYYSSRHANREQTRRDTRREVRPESLSTWRFVPRDRVERR